MEEKEPGEKEASPGVMECHPGNVQAFNARLRQDLPEAHAFARELHRLGLIDGLRGARIGPLGSLGSPGVPATLPNAAEERLKARTRIQR